MTAGDSIAPRSETLAAEPPTRDLAAALHEVSNALTVVVGWIDRARAAREAPDEVERALAVAISRASLARDIVRRAIGAEVSPDPGSTIAGVVGDAVLGLEPEARRAGVAVQTAVADGAQSVPIGRASTVLQILTNLLLNAIAVSNEGTTIHVEAKLVPSAGMVFSVTDEGPGVPQSRRATLFDAGRTTRVGGAGIGLRHAAALARAHGGELGLADTHRGARFELRWPMTREPSPASIPPPNWRTSRLSGSRILLVEDDEAVIDLLDTSLTVRGATVVSARSLPALIEALATGPFDAALFDISPIEEDIPGALAAVRAASKKLRLVVISGSAVSLPELPSGWVAAWVRKPFEIGEIVHALTGPLQADGSTPP
jgi:CheY-like chemotaxis protein